jgi:hypothetical protein
MAAFTSCTASERAGRAVAEFRGVAAYQSARGMQIADQPLLDCASHNGERAAKCGADIGNGAGLVPRFHFERKNAERFALRFGVANGGG